MSLIINVAPLHPVMTVFISLCAMISGNPCWPATYAACRAALSDQQVEPFVEEGQSTSDVLRRVWGRHETGGGAEDQL